MTEEIDYVFDFLTHGGKTYHSRNAV